MYAGFSMQLKDRRVDRILQRSGITNPEIIYSPIKTWVVFNFLRGGMLACLLVPLALTPIALYLWWLMPIIPAYLVISYIVTAHRCNSFAFAADALIVVNPNFPFRKVTVIPIKTIQKAKLSSKNALFSTIFTEVKNNCLEVTTASGDQTYHCYGLEEDAFDENWTELTIESLQYGLEGRGVVTTNALG